jgi:hypothetical protein
MANRKKKYKSYRKNRTEQEEYMLLIETRERLQFRLSHQKECYINSVRAEEMELEEVIRSIRVMDEIGFGMSDVILDPDLTLLNNS